MEIIEAPIKKIEFLDNSRLATKQTDVADLMASIKSNGLMQPIGLKETDKGYILIWGFRRLQAFKKLGYTVIPSIVFRNKDEELSETDFLIMNMGENIQRKNINIIEVGRGCKLLQEQGLSVSEIASRLGLPTSRITNALIEYNRVPEKYRDKVVVFNAGDSKKQGMLASTAALRIVKIRNLDAKQREELFDYVRKEEISLDSLAIINNLLRNGSSLKEAIGQIKNVEVWNVGIPMNKNKLNEVFKSKSKTQFVKDCLNSKYKDLVY